MYFVALLVLNCVFYAVPIRVKENWVKLRLYLVYIPVGVQMLLMTVFIALFLSELDKIHDKINNAYPVTEQDLRNSSTFVALTIMLYILPVFYQGLSYFAYIRELSLYYDKSEGNSPIETDQVPESNNNHYN